MLANTHKISFRFFNAGGADAIWIRYLGDDQEWHNVLVDGGYPSTYRDELGPTIREISSAKESIDLWIISHIDDDHISAVLGFVQDSDIKDKKAVVKQFWFNHSPHSVELNRRKVSVNQGVAFRTFLDNHSLLGTEMITNAQLPTNLYGLKITVVSPSPEKLNVAGELWQKIERKGKVARSAEKADHGEKFEALIREDFTADSNPWNGSSIACLLEYAGCRSLLLADSHADVVAAALRQLGASTEHPMELDFAQLGHHGSKFNTSPELLALIRTTTFVVTGNGINNRHPDKETLVRVLTHPLRPAGQVSFVFPCDTSALRDLFRVDQDVFSRYDFRLSYSQEGQVFQAVSYLPIEEN